LNNKSKKEFEGKRGKAHKVYMRETKRHHPRKISLTVDT
jgi:hypothetical protein